MLQVIAAPAVALAASLMELRRSQTPLHGPPPPQEALLVPNTLERTSSTFSVNPTIVRAASRPLNMLKQLVWFWGVAAPQVVCSHHV